MPINNNFWTTEELILYEFLLPTTRKVVRRGVTEGIEVISKLVNRPVAQLGINFEILDRESIRWAEENTLQVARQITNTNMDAFLREFPKWRDSGKPLRFLIDAIEPEYGIIRAKMIAVTEYGRAINNGNIIGWKETGMVEGKKVATVNDSHVSEICKFLNNKVVPIDGYFVDQNGDKHFAPPFHVGCRSRLQPVLTI